MKLVSKRFWLLASISLLLIAGWRKRPAIEASLADIEPAKDTLDSARLKLSHLGLTFDPTANVWYVDWCSPQSVRIVADGSGRLRSVSISGLDSRSLGCLVSVAKEKELLPKLRSSRGLMLSDSCQKAVAIYGKPESESAPNPSNPDVQSMTYDFSWAGPKVPQELQIQCDISNNTVVKMTLSASKS